MVAWRRLNTMIPTAIRRFAGSGMTRRVCAGNGCAADRHAHQRFGKSAGRLIGVTDVIAVDDTPSVFLDVRVHPVGDPARTALVKFDQLALYDD
jgi:hypothetical protein